jgi:alkylhydroperoxidase family enzyme
MDLFAAFPQSEGLNTELLELMRLRVAASHRCAYCGTVRTRSVVGAVEPKERAVFERRYEDLEAREALAVRLAEAMSVDPQGIEEAFFDELREAFTDAELVELLTFAAVEVGFDRFCVALRLDTDGESAYPSVSYPLELD